MLVITLSLTLTQSFSKCEYVLDLQNVFNADIMKPKQNKKPGKRNFIVSTRNIRRRGKGP